MAMALRALAAIPVLALGCSTEPQTCNLATNELVMFATVTDLDGEVEVEVEFEPIDGETSLELCPDRDTLTVNGVALEPLRVFGQQYYRAEFDVPADRYEIDLQRSGANSATVAIDMPPAFTITAPEPGSSYSRSGTLTVAWTPGWPDHMMQVSLLDDIGSSCVDGLGIFDEVEDVGVHEIGGASIAAADDQQSCELALVLTRERVVEHPPGGYAGGSITGVRASGFSLISTP